MFMLDDITLTCSESAASEPTPTPTTAVQTASPTSSPTVVPTSEPAQTAAPSQSQDPVPDIEISGPVFYKNEEALENIEDGDVQCRIEIKNNKSDECEVPSAMAVCVYDKSGKLIGISLGIGACTLVGGGTSQLAVDMTMPDMTSEEYHVKVLLWNDMESQTPALAAAEF